MRRMLLLCALFTIPGCAPPAGNGQAPVDPSLLADRTILYIDPQHGNQIEYTAADGRAYLWYPGNEEIVSGEWRMDPAYGRVCYRYPANVVNPVTGERGGDFWCKPYATVVDGIVEARHGDVFGLSERTVVPWVLTPTEPVAVPD